MTAKLADELDKWTAVHRVSGATATTVAPRVRRTSEDMKPKVERRMAEIDALTPEQRLVVHEYGWNLVRTFLDHGVTSPRSMRGLINAVTTSAVDRKDRLSLTTAKRLEGE